MPPKTSENCSKERVSPQCEDHLCLSNEYLCADEQCISERLGFRKLLSYSTCLCDRGPGCFEKLTTVYFSSLFEYSRREIVAPSMFFLYNRIRYFHTFGSDFIRIYGTVLVAIVSNARQATEDQFCRPVETFLDRRRLSVIERMNRRISVASLGDSIRDCYNWFNPLLFEDGPMKDECFHSSSIHWAIVEIEIDEEHRDEFRQSNAFSFFLWDILRFDVKININHRIVSPRTIWLVLVVDSMDISSVSSVKMNLCVIIPISTQESSCRSRMETPFTKNFEKYCSIASVSCRCQHHAVQQKRKVFDQRSPMWQGFLRTWFGLKAEFTYITSNRFVVALVFASFQP